MNRREQFQDQYEDALFALLMDDIATMEGKKAEEENKRLQNDPTAAVPEDIDRRCMRTIRRRFAKQKARAVGRFTLKTMKRVAIATGVAALLFTTAFAASETVRIRTLNLMIEVFETNTEFRFTSSSEQTPPQLEVGWVPDGYFLIEQGGDNLVTWYDYQNAENKTLSISCQKTDGLVVGIDTEHAEAEYVQIQDLQAMLVRKADTIQLVWAAQDNSIFITVWGAGMDQQDIVHIAEKLKY